MTDIEGYMRNRFYSVVVILVFFINTSCVFTDSVHTNKDSVVIKINGQSYTYDTFHSKKSKIGENEVFLLWNNKIRSNPCLVISNKSEIINFTEFDDGLSKKIVAALKVYPVDNDVISAVFSYSPDYNIYFLLNLNTKKHSSYAATYFWYDLKSKDVVTINYGKVLNGYYQLFINGVFVKEFEFKGTPTVIYYDKHNKKISLQSSINEKEKIDLIF